jgi:hypothetical protein
MNQHSNVLTLFCKLNRVLNVPIRLIISIRNSTLFHSAIDSLDGEHDQHNRHRFNRPRVRRDHEMQNPLDCKQIHYESAINPLGPGFVVGKGKGMA